LKSFGIQKYTKTDSNKLFKIVEKAFVETKNKATVSISGNTYEIDFKTKRQYQPNRGTRRRKVTRASRAELGDDRLGIAGVPQPREDPVIDLTDRYEKLFLKDLSQFKLESIDSAADKRRRNFFYGYIFTLKTIFRLFIPLLLQSFYIHG